MRIKSLQNIKVLIWDVDGTFYKHNSAHKEEIRESELRVIMDHTGWSHDKAETEFYKLYPKQNPSGTYVAAKISGITTLQAAQEGSKYNHVEKFIHRDQRLINLFNKLDQLNKFVQYILMNGTKDRALKIIKLLGLKIDVFKEIVTSENVGENKPSLAGFQYILNKTKLPPEEHLMIGDREEVDLVPAKQLGMKACLVWNEKPPRTHIDLVLPDVYNLLHYLI